MTHLIHSTPTLAVALLGVGLFHPALRLGRRGRLAALLLLGAVLVLAPLLVPASDRLIRALMAIGAVQGYQMAFFLIQGLAVALTLRLRPRGLLAALGIALTLAFNIISSLLFFASGNQILSWYSDAAPAWMKPR